MLLILDPYRRIQKTFHFHRKFEVIGLILFGVATSLFELFTATTIIPLILIIVDPQAAIRGRILGPLYRISNLHSTEHFAILLACILFLTLSLKAIVSILTWKYEFNVLNRWRISLCTAFFDAIIKAKHEVINKKGSSELINVLSSTIPYVISNYFQNLISICQQFTLAVFFIIFSLSINFTATVISAAFGVTLITLFVFIQRRKVRYLGDQTQKMNRQLVSVLQMSIFGLKETKMALKESYFTNRFHTLTNKTAKLSTSLQFTQNLPSIMVELLTLSTIIVTFIALVLFSHGVKSAAVQVSIIIFLGLRFIPLVNRTIVAFTMINSSIEPSNILLSLYHELIPETYANEHEFVEPIAFHRDIQFSHVSYHYGTAPSKDVLKDISFIIPKGHHVGIVGASGAGKSTLVTIILGFIGDYRGSFKVDDTKITDDKIIALRHIVSFVDQHPFFLNSSYIENIAYGEDTEEINLVSVKSCLERVGLLEHALKNSKGLNTDIGENGKYLSGGQRQRLAIARALYKNAKILILDEASSALDMDSEARLSKLLETLKGEITIISIAHRLSTLKTCDKVLFMDKGKIAAEGNFIQLYRTHTDFKRYVDQSNIEVS